MLEGLGITNEVQGSAAPGVDIQLNLYVQLYKVCDYIQSDEKGSEVGGCVSNGVLH